MGTQHRPQGRDVPGRQLSDIAVLVLVQGMSLPLLDAIVLGAVGSSPHLAPLVGVNAALVLMRVLLGVALGPSYAERDVPFWLSPLTDPLAVLRVVLSTMRRPNAWRSRVYPAFRSG